MLITDVRTPEDLLPPGGESGTVPTDVEQATGLERFELLGKMQGIDVFDMRPLDASRTGTDTYFFTWTDWGWGWMAATAMGSAMLDVEVDFEKEGHRRRSPSSWGFAMLHSTSAVYAVDRGRAIVQTPRVTKQS